MYRCRNPRIVAGAVQLDAALLEAADPQHRAQQLDARSRSADRRLVGHDGRSSVDRSPSGRPSSRAFSRRRMILPLRVLGRSSAKLDLARGHGGAQPLAGEPHELPPQLVGRLRARVQRHEGLDDLAGDLVGHADHARLDHRRVLDQHALDLEGPDEVAGGLDDVVAATDEPEVAVGVTPGEVAADVPPADEALARSARRRRGTRGTSTATRPAARARPPCRACPATSSAAVGALHDRGLDAGHRAAPSSRGGRRLAAKLAIMIAAGLGLPPVVVDGQAEGVPAPHHALGVQRLTDAGHEAQARTGRTRRAARRPPA